MRNLCVIHTRGREELCKLNREKRVIVNFLPNKITGGILLSFYRLSARAMRNEFVTISVFMVRNRLDFTVDCNEIEKVKGKGLSNWPPELPFRIIENFNGNNSNDMIPSRCLRDQIKISSRLSSSISRNPFLTYLSN